MKKLISYSILISFLFQSFSFGIAFAGNFDNNSYDFIANSLDPNLKIKPTKIELISDELIENLNPNLKIKERKETFENDDLVKYLNQNLKISKTKVEPIKDDFIVQNLNTSKISRINKANKAINFDKTIKISPKNFYSTKENLKEGKAIEFVLLDEIKINNKIYPKNSTITASVKNITQNSTFGLPSDLVIGNFQLQDLNFNSEFSIKGANRALWVYPAVYGLSCFFGAGLLFIPIRGGHAKLIPNKIYEIEI